jgi:hypothetical protein
MNREMMYFVRALAGVEIERMDFHLSGLAMKAAHSLAWMQGLTSTRDHPAGNASYAGDSCDLNCLNAQQMKVFGPPGVTEKHAFWP